MGYNDVVSRPRNRRILAGTARIASGAATGVRAAFSGATSVVGRCTAHALCPKARRADISVEDQLQINNELRQKRNSLSSGSIKDMLARRSAPQTKILLSSNVQEFFNGLLTELGESFSGCSFKYAAPNGAEERSFRNPRSTVRPEPFSHR